MWRYYEQNGPKRLGKHPHFRILMSGFQIKPLPHLIGPSMSNPPYGISSDTADSNQYETKLGYHFGWAAGAIGYREEFAGEFDEHAVLLALILRH